MHRKILLCILIVITMIPSSAFAAGLPFTDVSSSSWYYNDVKGAYETGLINGMTDNAFEPDSNTTYAQAIKLAACMHQKFTTGSVTLTNGSSEWWDSYVHYAKAFNIISKDYDWNSNATRAGYAEIFAKALPDDALNQKNNIEDNRIPDVSMAHPQAAAIYKLYRAGILTGTDGSGTFLPGNSIKRSEVSAIVTRMMNKDARKSFKLDPGSSQEGHNSTAPVDQIIYIVGFNSTGGSFVSEQKVKENEKALWPSDPYMDGYQFAGWYLDSHLKKEYNFDSPVTSDVTLYAKWNKKSAN